MNAKQRYNARRAAKNRESKAVERRMITAVATAMLGCSERAAKALTMIDGPAAPRQIQEDCGTTKQERRNRSVFYKDANPFGNKIHATQKQRGKSMPLI